MKYIALVALLTAAPATADIAVTFTESAPKDRFTFTNTAGCDLGPATLTLNLADSAAGLIFDTTGSGAGVEVFQPYETVSGGDVLGKVAPVKDGDTVIKLNLTGLAPNQSVAFTIDVDDTLTNGALGQIRVAGSEIAGATVMLDSDGNTTRGVFDTTSRASIKAADCTS